MESSLILSIDQGTSSTKTIIFNDSLFIIPLYFVRKSVYLKAVRVIVS